MFPDLAAPALHIRPDAGWLNDPNGVSRIDGTYHVFFQYNPDSPHHRDIRWGHVSSEDLLRWRTHPVALDLRPGGIDATGCWSGCVVDDDGVPTAVYSAIRERSSDAVVALARSDRDLVDWVQAPEGVMGPVTTPGWTETRDPFLFTLEGHRYAVLGTGEEGGRPAILVYACDDLEHWEERGVLLDDAETAVRAAAPGDIWECPNLVPLTDTVTGERRWVLLISYARIGGDRGVTALVGDLTATAEGPRFRPGSATPIDLAGLVYAPQVLLEGERVLLWGWLPETDEDEERLRGAGWAGALTLPWDLSLADGRLDVRPAPELEGLVRRPLPAGAPVMVAAFEAVHPAGGRLVLRAADGSERASHELPADGRTIVDGGILEIHADGSLPRTARTYPRPGDHWVLEGESVTTTALSLPA